MGGGGGLMPGADHGDPCPPTPPPPHLPTPQPDQTSLLKNMSHDAAEFLPQLKRRESICSSTHGLGGRWNRQGGVVVWEGG
jgi:hypothetical protein